MLFEQVQLAGVPLTTNIDTINVEGHAVNTVNGIIGASQTYQTGDTVNGNGLTKVALIVDDTNANNIAPIADLNNIAAVNVNLVSGTAGVNNHVTINELEYTNVAAVTVTNGVSGVVLETSNADLATVHGLAKAGRDFDLTVGYADVTGKADVAALSVAGTGSTTANSFIRAANGNGIEAVTLATSGDNYVTVDGGTAAAKYTLTGNGHNHVTISNAAATMTIDASATTGTNILNVGSLLTTTDTVKGGSGFDLLRADLTTGVQMIPTISGVENLELTFTGATTFNASNVTGVQEVEITPTTNVAATITNLNQTATTVRVGEHYDTGAAITATGAVAVGYATGSDSDVDFLVGAAKNAAGTAQAVSIGAVTFTNNAGALNVNSVGSATNTVASLTADKATSLTIAGADQALTISGAVSAINAADVTVDGSLKNTSINGLTVDSSVGTVNITSGAGTVSTGDISEVGVLTQGIDTTYNITGGAKNATVGNIAQTDIANYGEDVSVTANISATGAGNVSVGTISGSLALGLATQDITMNVNAEATSTGTVAITGVSMNEDASTGTATLNLDLAATGANATITTLTLTDNDAANITVSAVAGKTATITTLAETSGVLTSIVASGAGDISLFNTTPTANVQGAAVINATGTTGNFTLNLAAADDGLNVNLGNAATNKSNIVTTGDGADVVIGGSGVDVITTGGAADNIAAAGGDDTIQGGAGADAIDGGTGTNTATYAASAAAVQVSLVAGATNTGGDAAGDVLTNIQNLTGSDNADTLIGNTSANTFIGGLGADSITGGTGIDTFVFTSGLTIDTVTDFTIADDVAAFSLSALEAAGAVVAATTLDLTNGLGTSVAAGDTISVLTVAGATTTTSANVLVYTAGAIANAAALELALENAGVGLLTVGVGGAIAQNDSFVVQYTTAGGVERLAIVNASAAYAAGATIDAVVATDIAIVGTTANLGAANYSFIA